ncbi:MAG: protein TolR [Candidatus Dadabacteria bacterium]|nr:protein TolR [Candidatus Dadabacteria bacterium]NIQ14062.1 protein TolR [Candidatus Dadabacteria bacterium]
MAIGNTNKNGRTVLSEINVTPFVDVMLVLLIIFMVTTPILYQGVNVNLPKTSSKPIPSLQTDKKLMITLTKSTDIYIEDERYDISNLGGAIKEYILENGKEINTEQVFLRADSSVRYGYVIEVMSEIKKAGVEKVGLITEPK